jgi:hypothetical protein
MIAEQILLIYSLCKANPSAAGCSSSGSSSVDQFIEAFHRIHKESEEIAGMCLFLIGSIQIDDSDKRHEVNSTLMKIALEDPR